MKRERPGMMHLKKVTNTADYDSYGLPGAARPRPQLAAAGRRRPGRSPSRRPPTGVCGAPARPRGGNRTTPSSVSAGPGGRGRRGGRARPQPRRRRGAAPGPREKPLDAAGARVPLPDAPGSRRGRGPRGAARRRLRAAGLASPAAVTCPGRLPRSGALDGGRVGGPRAPWGGRHGPAPAPRRPAGFSGPRPRHPGRRDLESSRKADLQGWQRASPPGRPPTSRPAVAGSKAALNRARGTLSPAATHTDTHTKTSAGFLLTLPQRESSGSSELNPVVLTPN